MGLTDLMSANLMSISKVVLLAITCASPVAAQNVHVNVGKHSTAIPKVCLSVVPASLEGTVDVPALVKEAICKGAGDMIIEYTYVMNLVQREKDRKGQTKETMTTYEVFIPTLKRGSRTRGILLVTSRNGVPVPPNELEKERLRAANRIEEEEEKIARETPSAPEKNSNGARSSQVGSSLGVAGGMSPLGMYTRSGINRSTLFINRGSAVLHVPTFLTTCELTLLRREAKDGRPTLVFKFTPRPDAQFNASEKYIAQLTGEIWIDAQDRIVTRLVGWPAVERVTDKGSAVPATGAGGGGGGERPIAVHFEMLRLSTGVWLPHVTRINGAGYPKLFGGITEDINGTYSNYIRFSTEVKDVKIEPPKQP